MGSSVREWGKILAGRKELMTVRNAVSDSQLARILGSDLYPCLTREFCVYGSAASFLPALASNFPRVNHSHSDNSEIADVARHDSKTVLQSSGREQAIND